MIKNDVIANAKRIPIIDVANLITAVTRKGNRIIVKCGSCGKMYNNVEINFDENSAYCYCCATRYDTIELVKKYLNFTFPQAIDYLMEHFPQYFDTNFTSDKIVVKPVEIPEIDEDIEVTSKRASEILYLIHKYSLTVMADRTLSLIGRNYLASRGIYDEQIEKFRIGFIPNGNGILDFLREKGVAEDEMIAIKIKNSSGNCSAMNRIVFPIENDKRLTALCYRSINPNIAKGFRYMNSGSIGCTQIKNGLFGFSQLSDNVTNVVCCEGAMDAIALSEYSVPAVALGGLALYTERYRLLKSKAKDITLLLDTDEAGCNASLKIAKEHSDIYIAELPEETDPFDYVRKYNGGDIPFLVYDGLTAEEFLEKHKENK